MNKVLTISRRVDKNDTLPDGLYLGLLGGYNISVKYNDCEYNLSIKEGIRGFNIPVVVTVKDGEATYSFTKNRL